jgi:hypothetical protein
LLVLDCLFGWDDELATYCWSCTLSSLVLAWFWSWEPLAYTFELEKHFILIILNINHLFGPYITNAHVLHCIDQLSASHII